MIAREVETFWNGGAYADIGPRVTQKSGFTAAGPYDIEHVALDNYAVYTNEPPAGALRGFGISQLVVGLRAAGRHHRQNARHRPDRVPPPERPARGASARDRHDRISDLEIDGRAGPAGPAHGLATARSIGASGTIRRGRGVAIGLKACISPTTSVAIVPGVRGRELRAALRHRRHGAGARTRRWRRWRARCWGFATESVRSLHPDTDVDAVRHGARSDRGPRSTWATPCGWPRRGRPRAVAGHRGHALRRRSVRSRVL